MILKIDDVLNFAILAHRWQKRNYTNEDYIVHPYRVGRSLKYKYGLSLETEAGGYLHDTVEESKGKIIFAQIGERFGSFIQDLVFYTSKISTLDDGNRQARLILDVAHYVQGPAESHNIKIVDAMDNLESMAKHNPKFAKKYLLEKEYTLNEFISAGKANQRIITDAQAQIIRLKTSLL